MTNRIGNPEHLHPDQPQVEPPFPPLESRTLTLALPAETWAMLDQWEQQLDYPPSVVIDTAVVSITNRVDLDKMSVERALDAEAEADAELGRQLVQGLYDVWDDADRAAVAAQ